MAVSLLRKRRLRAPFVATVAAAATALLPGCGGKAAGEPSSGDGGAEAGPEAGPSQCPPTQPTNGSPCSGHLFCGDACGVPYGPVECVNGSWVQGAGGCNPPAPLPCPTTEPSPGTSCSNAAGQICSYPDECTGMNVAFTCVSGLWQGAGAPDGPVLCPSSVPPQGSSCAACAGRWPSDCNYGPDCNGSPTQTAVCDGTSGTWNILVSSCNPPPPPIEAGPPDAAVDGPSE
jgi:hypothetical protein